MAPAAAPPVAAAAPAVAATPGPVGVSPPPVSGRVSAGTDDPPGVVARSGPRRGGGAAVRAATWGTLVAGVASFGMALKFGLDVNAINNELDPHRRFACAPSIPSTQAPYGCKLDGKPATMPLTEMEKKFVKDQQAEGERFQKYQYIAIGVGSALVVASGVFFYFGYLSDGGSVAILDGGARLQVAPMASTRGGGATARITF
jgi:hypothetical protein